MQNHWKNRENHENKNNVQKKKRIKSVCGIEEKFPRIFQIFEMSFQFQSGLRVENTKFMS
jgi:hypothetical protein